MKYAQIDGGLKLHLVYEAGEGSSPTELIPAGHVSPPLCHTGHFRGSYRMTINVPLGRACKNCIKVYRRMVREYE